MYFKSNQRRPAEKDVLDPSIKRGRGTAPGRRPGTARPPPGPRSPGRPAPRRRAVDRLAAQGVTLIVTVDCGITAAAEVEYARSLGVEVVVTDHHHRR